MNNFQIFGVSLALAVIALVLYASARRRIGRRAAAAWTLLWAAAAVAIAQPQLTVVLAQALGIERGADLIFYLAILAMLIGFFLVYVRLRRLEHDLTVLVRQLAIDRREPPEADRPDAGGTPAADLKP